MRLSIKLPLLILVVVLVAGAGATFVMYEMNLATMKSGIVGELELLVFHEMEGLNRYLFERYSDIQMIASDPVISLRSSTPKEITERLIEFRNTYKAYLSLSFLDLGMVRIADTFSIDVGKRHPPTKWLDDTLQGRVSAAADIYYSNSTGFACIYFASPVWDEKGEVFGIVVARVPLRKIYEVTNWIYGRGVYERGDIEVDVIDKEGLLLYSSVNKKGILKDNMSDWDAVKKIKETPESMIGSLIVYDPFFDEEDIFAYARDEGYFDFKGNGWTMLLHLPTRVAFAPVAALRNKIIAIITPIFLLAAVATLIISRAFTRPIARLKDAAFRMGRGDLDTKIEISSNDEIGDLALSLNKMAENLQKISVSRGLLLEEVAARNKAEEELTVLSRFPSESPSPVLRISRDGKVLYSNDAAVEILKEWRYEETKEVPERWRSLIKKVFKAAEEAEEEEEEEEEEEVGAKVFSFVISPVKAEGYVNLYGCDITKRKIAETERKLAFDLTRGQAQELKRSRHALISIMEDVNTARDVAVTALKVKGDFLANISHEIRTPINAIQGFTGLLRNTKLSRRQKDYIETIRTSGEMLLVLINDILDISKMETHKLRLEEEDFSLNELLDSVFQMIEPVLKGRGISLRKSIGKNVPNDLRGDPMRIKQVLLNLLNNAVKFTERGEISLRTESDKKSGDNVRLRFFVKDTGIGIPEDKHEKIFDTFSQLSPPMTKERGGLGLGLSISKTLVEIMGGEINVRSRPGEGSEFFFTLSLKKALSPAKAKGARAAGFDRDRKLECKGAKVLVAEDDAINQKLMKEMLNNMGCEVDIALNGEDALKKIKASRYDIVFMDLKMPVMDGFTATRAIRGGIDKKLPIIALTAFAGEDDRKRCLDAGMDDYIAKPFDKKTLRKKILEWAGKRKTA